MSVIVISLSAICAYMNSSSSLLLELALFHFPVFQFIIIIWISLFLSWFKCTNQNTIKKKSAIETKIN